MPAKGDALLHFPRRSQGKNEIQGLGKEIYRRILNPLAAVFRLVDEWSEQFCNCHYISVIRHQVRYTDRWQEIDKASLLIGTSERTIVL